MRRTHAPRRKAVRRFCMRDETGGVSIAAMGCVALVAVLCLFTGDVVKVSPLSSRSDVSACRRIL